MDVDGDAPRFYLTFGDRRWRWPIVAYVGTRLDWQQFLRCCSPRDRRIVNLRQQGYQQAEIAARLRVSSSAVCQRLRALRRRWDAQAVA